jgi:hypothetical protein
MRRKKGKGKGKRNKKKNGRVLWTFHFLIHLPQPREAVSPNVSSKQF